MKYRTFVLSRRYLEIQIKLDNPTQRGIKRQTEVRQKSDFLLSTKEISWDDGNMLILLMEFFS